MKNFRKIAPKKVRKMLKQASHENSNYKKLCFYWEQTYDESLLIIEAQRADIRKYNKKIEKLWVIIYTLSTLLCLSMVFGLM